MGQVACCDDDKFLLSFCSFCAEMDLWTSPRNGVETPEEGERLAILTCPAVMEFQRTLYPKGLFTRGALVSVLTVNLGIANSKCLSGEKAKSHLTEKF